MDISTDAYYVAIKAQRDKSAIPQRLGRRQSPPKMYSRVSRFQISEYAAVPFPSFDHSFEMCTVASLLHRSMDKIGCEAETTTLCHMQCGKF